MATPSVDVPDVTASDMTASDVTASDMTASDVTASDMTASDVIATIISEINPSNESNCSERAEQSKSSIQMLTFMVACSETDINSPEIILYETNRISTIFCRLQQLVFKLGLENMIKISIIISSIRTYNTFQSYTMITNRCSDYDDDYPATIHYDEDKEPDEILVEMCGLSKERINECLKNGLLYY